MGTNKPLFTVYSQASTTLPREALRQETVNAQLSYVGYAQIGASSSDSKWLISRITTSEAGDQVMTEWANGSASYNSTWDSGASASITSATQASPCEITSSAAHGFNTGDKVIITGVAGMTALNNRQFTITTTGSATFTLDGVDSSSYGAYTSGGTVYRPEYAQISYS